MGGKGKKSLAAMEKQQLRMKEEEERKKKKAKKEEKREQKPIYVSAEAYQELLKLLKPNSYYTLYELATRLNVPLGMARRAIRQLEKDGKLVQISKAGNSRLFVVK